MESLPVGIDVGSSSSSLAVFHAGSVHTVTVPTVVSVFDDTVVVGSSALDRMTEAPAQTVTGFNRRLGTNARINLPGELSPVSPVELTASVLRALCDGAPIERPSSIDRAVLTVPATYTATQRRALRTAGAVADISVDRIIDDPTATAIGYCAQTDIDGRLFVYDLGGGTFDAAVIDRTDGLFDVCTTGGDARIGSDAFDAAIVEWLEIHLEQRHDVVIGDDPVALQQLFQTAQAAKHALATHRSTEISTTITHRGNEYDIEQLLHRTQFERQAQPIVERTIGACESLLEASDIPKASIDHLLIVGQTAQLSFIPEAIERSFGQSATIVTADAITATGAAHRGAWIRNIDHGASEPGVVIDVVPHSICVHSEPRDRREWIPNNAAVPARTTTIVTTRTNRQESIIVPVYYDFSQKTTHRPPTIETDTSETRHEKGTHHRSTDGDSRRTSATESAERRAPSGLLDAFRIGPLPPQPAGEPAIELTLECSSDGVVSATATSQATDQHTQIDAVSLFSHDESTIERMKRDRPPVRR
ncbi:Hsp70 family protein [Halocatena halophila]|uniref:Hsp70 family protein n=1 Tax=Halocatena halophila TaxID=2814576 RepID=UPI002ECFF633